MRTFETAHFSAVVCDPPYGLEFMGEGWDAPWKHEITEHPSGMTAPRFSSTRNPVCRSCRRMKRGAEACSCEEPDFDESPADEARAFQAWCESWAAEAFRVLKPGGFLLAFGGTRTYHRLACALEDAGFELRDCVQWWYGGGFPKSHNVMKAIDREGLAGAEEWEGWGTALKPAYEPIVVARKPLSGTVVANVLVHGTGAMNIGASRIGTDAGWSYPNGRGGQGWHGRESLAANLDVPMEAQAGRWPANLILSHSPTCEPVGTAVVKNDGHFPDASGSTVFQRQGFEGRDGWPVGDEVVEVFDCAPGCPIAELDRQTGDLKAGGNLRGDEPSQPFGGAVYGEMERDGRAWQGYGDRGGASRFFYNAKVTRSERDAGLDDSFEVRPLNWSSGDQSPGTFQADGTEREARNDHPTVKPVDVMRWLLTLVTPPGGVVLDPFAGSGSTLCAAALEGIEIVGIEQDERYARIAEARLAFWLEHGAAGFEVARRMDGGRRRRKRAAKAGQLDLLT